MSQRAERKIIKTVYNSTQSNTRGLALQVEKVSHEIIILEKHKYSSWVARKNCNSSAFLLHTRKTFSNVELFLNFFTNFFGTNFRYTKGKQYCWNNQLFCLPTVKKILLILCLWTLKNCWQINEYWFNKNVCLNIVLKCRSRHSCIKLTLIK